MLNLLLLVPAIEQGKLTEDFVRESVKPLFYTRFRIGEFDPPSMNPYATLDKDQIVLSSEHRELALRAAINTFVLLKNENNTLPLQKNFKKIAVGINKKTYEKLVHECIGLSYIAF